MAGVKGLPAFGFLASEVRDHVYLFDDGFIFTSAWVWTRETSRFPAVLLLSLDERPFVLRSAGERTESCCAAIAPQVLRSLDARDRLLASVHIEPGHPAYAAFRAIGGSGVRMLERESFAQFHGRLLACHRGDLDLEAARLLFEELLDRTTPSLPSAQVPPDERIQTAISSLREQPDQSLSQLAEMLDLSYDHLSHLFSRQIGLPLKRLFER